MNNYYNKIEDNQALIVKLILFVICPFFAFVYSLFNASKRSSYVIYFLFGVLFCWHMNPTGSDRYDDLMGMLYYIVNFNTENGFKSFTEELKAYLTFSDNSPKELYMDFIIWTSRLITDNPHFVFALASIPFLFFQLKTLKLITDDSKFKDGNILCLIIIALFVFQRDIITVQNPRFTTALWMGVYATILYFNGNSNKIRFKYLLLICLTPLIHSAFWFYIIIFILGIIFFLRYPKISIVLLYISIPFSYLSYDIISQFNFEALSLPPIFEIWINNYLSEEKFAQYILHEGASGFFCVQAFFTMLTNTVFLFIPIMLWKDRKYINARPDLKDLFHFYLYFYAVVNFIQFIPVLGTRFTWIVFILSIYMFFKVYGTRKKNFIILLLFSFSYSIVKRYFYGGALSSVVPTEIFYMPLPYLIWEYIGISPSDVKAILRLPS